MSDDDLSRFSAVLPEGTADAWRRLAPLLPAGGYLAGGTAIAIHLQHRISRDLDIFFADPFDRDALLDELDGFDDFIATDLAAGTINGQLGATKVQFLDASSQVVLAPTVQVAGMPVASLEDLLAMKLKVVGDRGQLRDYFDVMAIELRTDLTAEQGFRLYIDRYRPRPPEQTVNHILLALGYLDDVADDPYLEGIATRDEIERYWHRRQPEIARRVATYGVPER